MEKDKLKDKAEENTVIVKPATESRMALYLRELRPNALWWLLTIIGGALMSTGGISGFLAYISTISLNWIVVLGLFIFSLIFWSAAILVSLRTKLQTTGEEQTASTENQLRKPSYKTIIALIGIVIVTLLAGFFIGRYSSSYSDDFNSLIRVSDKKFSNQEVLLDGFHYENCTFTNVKFIYKGTGVFNFRNNNLIGTKIFYAPNPVSKSTIVALKGLGYLIDEAPLMNENEKIYENIQAPNQK